MEGLLHWKRNARIKAVPWYFSTQMGTSGEFLPDHLMTQDDEYWKDIPIFYQQKLVRYIINLLIFVAFGSLSWTYIIIKILFTIFTRKHLEESIFCFTYLCQRAPASGLGLKEKQEKNSCLQVKDLLWLQAKKCSIYTFWKVFPNIWDLNLHIIARNKVKEWSKFK